MLPALAWPAAVTVTYGVVSWNPFHWVVMVGTAKGQFEKHGVKLDIPMTGSSGAAVGDCRVQRHVFLPGREVHEAAAMSVGGHAVADRLHGLRRRGADRLPELLQQRLHRRGGRGYVGVHVVGHQPVRRPQ